ncbi:hypothetical protein CHS0354_031413 [Potamilus streckersoni]|uniref:Uncharacterized protein n=1 Tax=Potamilus streckersoni TaxID=2493646 RepID=A0AAE0SYV1_9BIVA|nr:hypothetical protein CHS0354_031413 [Potamilus streckersoni]
MSFDMETPETTTIIRNDVPAVKREIVEKDKRTQIYHISKPLKDCRPAKIAQFKADYTDGKDSGYTGLTCLPDGKILLVDYHNYTCRLYDQSNRHLADYTLNSSPCDVCVIEGFRVAVTLPDNKEIQLLTVNNSIHPGRTINTNLHCYGIVALSEDKLVVSGRKKDSLYWCIISMNGSVNLFVEVCHTIWSCSLATNNSKTRIYVSCFRPSAVYVYGVDGTLIFTYTHDDLDGARGVAVDRDENMYVVGEKSVNIHQVSPNGTPLHVFSTGIPKSPEAICFTCSGDKFVLMGDFLLMGDRKLVQIFELI